MKNSKRTIPCLNRSALLALLTGCLALQSPAASEPTLADRVEALREVLASPIAHPVKSPQELKGRREALQQRAAALRGPAELRQAVKLREWRDDGMDSLLADAERPIRADLVKRLDESLRQAIRSPDRGTQLAALAMVAESGTDIQFDDNAGFGRHFAPDLVALIQNNDHEVRQAAAHALGHVFPEPGLAAPALGNLLKSFTPEDRRSAARALADMIRVASTSTAPFSYWGLHASAADVGAIGQAVLPPIGRGLADSDQQVRRLCADGFRQAALVLSLQADQALQLDAAGREGGRLNARGEVIHSPGLVKMLEDLRPVATALKEQGPLLVPLLQDADPETCVSASQALEAIADTRSVLEPIQKAAALDGNETLDRLLLQALRPALPGLARELSRKEPQVRLAAFYVLESLGPESAPAVGSVVTVVKDPDSFIRWAAARTLAKMAPAAPEKAVPGLAELTADPNGDVRGAALSGLRRYGRAAKEGVPALSRALQQNDPGTKLLALQALAAIGPGAESAVPALTAALSAPQPELRAAAARALGKIGPAAASAEGALIKMLQDPDADVRQAAADAVLMMK